MVEYYDEERPPSCKVTALVLIIVFFIAHEIMTIGLISSLSTSNPIVAILVFFVLSSFVIVLGMYWFIKQNERWMKHKFSQKSEKDEQELDEQRWY
jgi:protein-S-isoprenylcysteine O-methyltransferase Ste14